MLKFLLISVKYRRVQAARSCPRLRFGRLFAADSAGTITGMGQGDVIGQLAPAPAGAQDRAPQMAARGPAAQLGPMLSIVIPTFSERDNIRPLLARLEALAIPCQWEAIFVDDDSPDGTAALIAEIAQTKPHVRLIRRIGRRGLSSAVIEGLQSSTAQFLAVMDADLQHDETLVPRMLALLQQNEADVVIGSRYAAGGSTGEFSAGRVGMSRLATRISRLVVSREVTDPMSGFFMLTRGALDRSVRRLSGEGFKILLDILASSDRGFRVRELPYRFRARLHGDSKLDALVLWEYLMLVADKLAGGIVPVRFLIFGLVGLTGVGVHFAALTTLLAAQAGFGPAQTAATVLAMTSNFVINNVLTYRDRRLRGWGFVRGLITFYLLCSVGLLANVGVAVALFHEAYSWWLSAIAGILVGTVWNYAATSVFTWRR